MGLHDYEAVAHPGGGATLAGVATDYDTALTELHRQLFGPPPTDAATAAPPQPTGPREGGNPPATLAADQVFRDWALRVIDANQYRALNPTPLADMVARD